MSGASSRSGRRAVLLTAGMVVLTAFAGEAGAQSVGIGASPGRAAYRPQYQWNNGPYYTADHWNPYAPRAARFNDLVESDPVLPPWTNGPHGRYAKFTPGKGTLFPYQEGFSPYSGFAGWYERTYRFTPTRDDIIRARTEFFRSAPRPPASVLPPLPPAEVLLTPRVVTPAPRVPSPARAADVRPAVPVYRSSVTGS